MKISIRSLGRRLGRLLIGLTLLFAAYLLLSILGLVYLRFFDPLTTTVHLQRRLESILQPGSYRKEFQFIPLERISSHLRRAVIAAEDGRFYEHGGIDFLEIRKVLDEDRDRMRGASTITQQLVKNLFMTTHRQPLRKIAEFVLAPAAEFILGKDRILELYLNVIEWGPGVYGVEAAARRYYQIPASQLGRERSARLAAVLPAPLRRKPSQVNRYSQVILNRMASRGW